MYGLCAMCVIGFADVSTHIRAALKRILRKDLLAERMDRANCRLVNMFASTGFRQNLANAILQLPRRFLREGHEQDLPDVNRILLPCDEFFDDVLQSPRLARSRRCLNHGICVKGQVLPGQLFVIHVAPRFLPSSSSRTWPP